MENKNNFTGQDKAKIQSIITMAIANKCYEAIDSNKELEIIPAYCSMFIGSGQKGEIALLQAYNISRQLGRPTSVTALMNILLQDNATNYYDKVNTTVVRNIIGYDGKVSLKETAGDKIEFNILILIQKIGNGIEVLKLQVYDKPLELTKEKALNITLPWCHNIAIPEEDRNAAREEIINTAKIAAQKIDEKIKEQSDRSESSKEETIEHSSEEKKDE